jgi:hypothetical protein
VAKFGPSSTGEARSATLLVAVSEQIARGAAGDMDSRAFSLRTRGLSRHRWPVGLALPCLYDMSRRMNRGGVDLTVDGGELPGAVADAAEAPIAPTQGSVGELTGAGTAGAPASFNLDDGARAVNHLFGS